MERGIDGERKEERGRREREGERGGVKERKGDRRRRGREGKEREK